MKKEIKDNKYSSSPALLLFDILLHWESFQKIFRINPDLRDMACFEFKHFFVYHMTSQECLVLLHTLIFPIEIFNLRDGVDYVFFLLNFQESLNMHSWLWNKLHVL